MRRCADCRRPMATQSAWRRASFDRTGFVRVNGHGLCIGCDSRARRARLGGPQRVYQLAFFSRREAT